MTVISGGLTTGKLWRVFWAVMGTERNTCNTLATQLKGKKPRGKKTRCRWDVIKMDITQHIRAEIGFFWLRTLSGEVSDAS